MTQLEISPTVLAEYDFDFDPDLAIGPDVADLLFRDAHTANAFTDAPVSDAQLRAVYDLIKWGPTAMNTQPLRVALIQSGEARERLVAHMAEGNKAKTLAAPLVAVLAADLDFHDEMHKVFPVFPGAKDAFADEAMRTGSRHAQHLAADRLLHHRCPGRRAGCRTDGRLRCRRREPGVLPRRPPSRLARGQHRPAVR